jgi:hypothetical protein
MFESYYTFCTEDPPYQVRVPPPAPAPVACNQAYNARADARSPPTRRPHACASGGGPGSHGMHELPAGRFAHSQVFRFLHREEAIHSLPMVQVRILLILSKHLKQAPSFKHGQCKSAKWL